MSSPGAGAERVSSYEILCLIAEQRGWKLKLGVLTLRHAVPPHLAAKTKPNSAVDALPHSILAGLLVERPAGNLEARGFAAAQNLQEAASDLLDELEREGVFRSS
jgi:hypothetical protein